MQKLRTHKNWFKILISGGTFWKSEWVSEWFEWRAICGQFEAIRSHLSYKMRFSSADNHK